MTDPMAYTVFQKGETNVAGMLALSEEMKDVPPNWSTYFSVEDAETTTALIKKLGGTVIVPPTKIPNTGTFACFLDPQGAAFSILEPEPME